MVLQFADRGGTYDFRPDGDDSAFWPRGRNPGRYVYRPPLQRADGWPTASVDEVGIGRDGIESFIQRIIDTPIDSLNAPQVEGILIARHGKLVVEEYFHGENRDRLHETRSAAKSLTATLVGAAIQDGLPVRLDDKVYAVMNGGRVPRRTRPAQAADDAREPADHDRRPLLRRRRPQGARPRRHHDRRTPTTRTTTTTPWRLPMDRRPGRAGGLLQLDPNLAIGVLWRATGEHRWTCSTGCSASRCRSAATPGSCPVGAALRRRQRADGPARLHEAGPADAQRRDMEGPAGARRGLRRGARRARSTT